MAVTVTMEASDENSSSYKIISTDENDEYVFDVAAADTVMVQSAQGHPTIRILIEATPSQDPVEAEWYTIKQYTNPNSAVRDKFDIAEDKKLRWRRIENQGIELIYWVSFHGTR